MKSVQRLFHFTLRIAALNLALCCLARAGNLVQNPGFESQADGWTLFVPPASKDKIGEFTVITSEPQEGGACAQGSASDFVRYGIAYKEGIPVKAGERYRISAWVRYGADSVIKDGFPQVYIRATLRKSAEESITDPLGHMHIGLSGEMARTPNVWKFIRQEVTHEWRKIEGVIEIPAETTFLIPQLFVEGVKGYVYWDNVSLEKVPADTTLSPDVLSRN